MKRFIEEASQSTGPMPKEIRIALMEDHRWQLTDLDREIILRLKNQSSDDLSSENSSETDITVIPNTAQVSTRNVDEIVIVSPDAIRQENTSTPVHPGLDPDFLRMINFIIKVPRLLFCYEAVTWRELREDHSDIGDAHTCEELRDIFITNILPKVFSFHLPQTIKKAFSILEFSSSFERIPTGYLVNPLEKCKSANMPLVRNVDYTVIDARQTAIGSCELSEPLHVNAEGSVEKFVLDTQKSNPAPPQIAVVVGDSNFFKTGRHTQSSSLTPTNLALCSAVVSYDFELFNSTCLPPNTILERLRFFKQRYEQTGLLSENFNPQRLREKYKKLMELRKVIIEITNKRFSMEAMDTNKADW